jgi:hypothetical protein
MAMAEHAAAIRGVHLDGLCHSSVKERRTRKIIADDGLQVAVAKATAGLKRGHPRGLRREY